MSTSQTSSPRNGFAVVVGGAQERAPQDDGGALNRSALLVLPISHEIVDHGGIGQGRGVAEA